MALIAIDPDELTTRTGIGPLAVVMASMTERVPPSLTANARPGSRRASGP